MNTSLPSGTFPKAGPGNNKTISHMLGEITWLLSQSKVHKNLFISDLEWMVMPAILLEQFRIFYGPDSPAAVAIFARVSEETDERLRTGGQSKLRADEWKNGDIQWLIELITPLGGQEEVLQDLATSIFKEKPFNFHTVEGGKRIVKTLSSLDFEAKPEKK